MRVDIILVNWRGWRDTIECLESVFRLDYPEFRVIVVDNGSADGSLEQIKRWAAAPGAAEPVVGSPLAAPAAPLAKPVAYLEYDRAGAERGPVEHTAPLVLIQSGANLGFAGGNNVGLRYAMRADGFAYAWLLNNDTVVEVDALAALVRRSRQVPSAGIVGSTLLYYARPSEVQAYGGAEFQPWRAHAKPIGIDAPRRRLDAAAVARGEASMGYVIGASMLVTAAFLRQVGLMQEDYFLYYEELDWARRGSPAFGLAYAEDSVVYHKVGGSATPQSLLSLHFLYRSRLRFMRRHYRGQLLNTYVALIWRGVKALLRNRRAEAVAIGRVLRDADAWPEGVQRPEFVNPLPGQRK
jgi:GT2 family glycosyltransferase